MHYHSTSSFSNLACPPYSISKLISVVSVQIRDEMEQGIFLMGFCRIHSFIQGLTEASFFTIGLKFSYNLVYGSKVQKLILRVTSPTLGSDNLSLDQSATSIQILLWSRDLFLIRLRLTVYKCYKETKLV